MTLCCSARPSSRAQSEVTVRKVALDSDRSSRSVTSALQRGNGEREPAPVAPLPPRLPRLACPVARVLARWPIRRTRTTTTRVGCACTVGPRETMKSRRECNHLFPGFSLDFATGFSATKLKRQK
jgi:hypothetical protein